jgi:hypothetical protein
MSRILCVWSPNWAIETWRRRRPSAPQVEPFALVGPDRGLRVLTAVSPQAAAAGLFPGQRVTDAQALRPDLVLAEAEPVRLYPAGDGAFEFERTASRLQEMRSEDWLADRS